MKNAQSIGLTIVRRAFRVFVFALLAQPAVIAVQGQQAGDDGLSDEGIKSHAHLFGHTGQRGAVEAHTGKIVFAALTHGLAHGKAEGGHVQSFGLAETHTEDAGDLHGLGAVEHGHFAALAMEIAPRGSDAQPEGILDERRAGLFGVFTFKNKADNGIGLPLGRAASLKTYIHINTSCEIRVLESAFQPHGTAQGRDLGRRKRTHAARSQRAQLHGAFLHALQAKHGEIHIAAHTAYLAVQALMK